MALDSHTPQGPPARHKPLKEKAIEQGRRFLGAVQAARVLGLRVPEDLSVVGFDDLPLTRFTDPPLTTVHQPVRRKGEEAARLLLSALSAPKGEAPPLHRVLETRLVVRHSTAPPPVGRRLEVVAS